MRSGASELYAEAHMESLGVVRICGLVEAALEEQNDAKDEGDTLELVSVTPKELRERTRLLRPLRVDEQLTPPYRSAPCVRAVLEGLAVPPVTVVFLLLGKAAAGGGATGLRDAVRRTAREHDGYICEENMSSGFVLSFDTCASAAEFAVALHRLLESDKMPRTSSPTSSFSSSTSSMSPAELRKHVRIGMYAGPRASSTRTPRRGGRCTRAQ